MFFALRKQLRRISVRLTFWYALLSLAAVVTALGLNYAMIERRLLENERGVTLMRLMQYIGAYEMGGLPALKERVNWRKGRVQGAAFTRIADAQNRTVFLRDAEDWTDFSPERLEKEKTAPKQAPYGWLTLDSPSGAELLLGFSRLSDGSLIQVGDTTEHVQEQLAEFRRVSTVVLLIFLPASIVGGVFLASRALRPVQHLTSAAERIVATARFDARVPTSGTNDELDALVHLFNKMLGRIDVLIHGLRDSLDNVAHDLRTPMTRLRQKAQHAIENAETLESARDALADCVEEAERAMKLLNTLMDIAEAESGLLTLPRLPIEIAALAQGKVHSYAEVAEEKGVTVTADVPPGLCVSGDIGALRRVFANLLDNAIKYTPAGGRVRITAVRTDQGIAIHFTDTGCGIPPEDLPRIWDRLFRGDKSRSERGFGLGLSFVRAIVASHGGTATVISEPGAGTKVTIVLPAGIAESAREIAST